MYSLKSIKLYFFSIIKLFFLVFRNLYFKTNFYNKKLITAIPDRIFYSPSPHLSGSLISFNNDFYKVTSVSPNLLWKTDVKNKLEFENLHSFLWLTRLSRKNNKDLTKKIIRSWIYTFNNYETNTWKMEIIAKRIIAWSSNTDLTLENSDKSYKDKFFLSIIKQSNFILRNFNNLLYEPDKIVCCAAIILSGIVFGESYLNYKIGIKELEKIIKNYFNLEGFPKSRNPEEIYICLKYLILIREWLKEAQKPIPDFLNTIISKSGNCYMILSSSNKQFPLFNGATEINHKEYDMFLKNLKYKFTITSNEVANFFKVKEKKFEFFIDCGNPPPDSFSKYYQAGCLAFELISNKQKIICNSGYGKYLSPKLASLSRSTAAHSTLYINDTSSCTFQKNKFINKVYGNSLIKKHKIIKKKYIEDKEFYSIQASHNGYEKKFGYIHERNIKILKDKNKVIGEDILEKTKSYLNPLYYTVRFHIYHNVKIAKTKSGNSILISLSNGEGWLLRSETNDLNIEKSVFLGNKNKVISNECIFISGDILKDIISIKWELEKVS
tara:strand:+ start:570 stop:2225 length:1656 start_codon:yes stop_codon:yes gene_type:complete